MFPRIVVHTGNTVVLTNKHPEWQGTVVLQHNETTCTILKFGDKLSRAARKRHPLLSTFQSNCESLHWQPLNSNAFQPVNAGFILNQAVDNGEVISGNEPP